jgi:hypothetical protein
LELSSQGVCILAAAAAAALEEAAYGAWMIAFFVKYRCEKIWL